MNAKAAPYTEGHYCKVHQTHSPRVLVECPYGRHLTHVHEADVKNAKRGWKLVPRCVVCRREIHVLVGGKLESVKVVADDSGSPAIQGRLGIKTK